MTRLSYLLSPKQAVYSEPNAARCSYGSPETASPLLFKETRIGNDLTQVDVAKRLGVPQSYVSKYESGERRLDFVETTEVCEALGTRIEDFAARYSAKLAKARRTKGAER